VTGVEDLIARLDAAEAHLAEHAGSVYEALTDAEPDTHEQWEAGQVWAHLAEFVPYWMREIEDVIGAASDDAVSFGRVKTDEGRLAAIERDRHSDVMELMSRVSSSVERLRIVLAELEPHEWDARGRHATLGEMRVAEIVERFLVGHLEEHAEQLDRLAEADTAGR
jgi:hypothetical protein